MCIKSGAQSAIKQAQGSRIESLNNLAILRSNLQCCVKRLVEANRMSFAGILEEVPHKGFVLLRNFDQSHW